MQIKVLENTPQLIRVALVGELDTFNIEHIGQVETKLTALLACDGQNAIVDLSGVSMITSIGIGLLITLSKMVKQRGDKFVLLKPQPDVAKVIQLSRLTELLGVACDESSAQSLLSTEGQSAA